MADGREKRIEEIGKGLGERGQRSGVRGRRSEVRDPHPRGMAFGFHGAGREDKSIKDSRY